LVAVQVKSLACLLNAKSVLFAALQTVSVLLQQYQNGSQCGKQHTFFI